MSSVGLNMQHAVASIFKHLPANLQEKFMALAGPQPIMFRQFLELLGRHLLIEKVFQNNWLIIRKEVLALVYYQNSGPDDYKNIQSIICSEDLT